MRSRSQNFKFVLMSYPRRKGMNILLKQGNQKCFYASTPSEPAQTCPHIHSSNGGFQLVYDSSTIAVVGMIRDLAHTDSLWLANNLQEQFGQTNEEKITSKQQNESQTVLCGIPVCPGACDAPAGPLEGRRGICGPSDQTCRISIQ